MQLYLTSKSNDLKQKLNDLWDFLICPPLMLTVTTLWWKTDLWGTMVGCKPPHPIYHGANDGRPTFLLIDLLVCFAITLWQLRCHSLCPLAMATMEHKLMWLAKAVELKQCNVSSNYEPAQFDIDLPWDKAMYWIFTTSFLVKITALYYSEHAQQPPIYTNLRRGSV